MRETQNLPECRACEPGAALGFDFTFAFQPIVDLERGRVFGHEALVRGLAEESAGSILAQVGPDTLYRFDQVCRVKAVQLASDLGLDSVLSINFLPNAVYKPETCIRTTLAAANKAGLPIDRILFEITEREHIVDRDHLLAIVREYQRLGFKTAMDDFGAGYSRLGLLSEYRPDYLKIDLALVRDVHRHVRKQAIVRAILSLCRDLGIAVIAEGVEDADEARYLRDAGVSLFQGFYFARPSFEALAEVPAERLALA